jgi:hypothetical protein
MKVLMKLAIFPATFTAGLCEAISAEYGTARLMALPVSDTEQRWSLAQDDLMAANHRLSENWSAWAFRTRSHARAMWPAE